MLTLHAQRKIKFFAVEKPTLWLIYAAVVEIRGEETLIVSEPKLVKVRQKQVIALPGRQTKNVPLAISAPITKTAFAGSIASPYFSYEVSKDPNFLVWYNARPPTFV